MARYVLSRLAEMLRFPPGNPVLSTIHKFVIQTTNH